MNLELLAQRYTPPTNIEFLKSTKIVLLVGISGAGKDTIQSRLIEKSDYRNIVTHTTRAPRENNGIMETQGREYHFVSLDDMKQLLEQNEMIEINKFGENYYGTSLQEFRSAYDEDKIALGDIDIHGIASFRGVVGDGVRAIFVVPPSYESWLQRLSNRYSSKDELERELVSRASSAVTELEHALSVPYYHFLINDELERAIGAADDIAHRPDVFVRQDDEARLRARDLLDSIKSTV